MSTTPQAFYLRLNNHQGFMTGALADLYSKELMVDVTLTADGQLIRAHKIVLSACSPYFKNILLQFHSNSQYPVIILKDIPFSDLKAIIEFIYRGEITVPHHQLESILAHGALLQIKGLAEVNKKKVPVNGGNDNVSVVSKDDNDKGSDANSLNQIKQIKTNKKRKLRKSCAKEKIGSNFESSAASNGDDGGSCGDISSLADSNDGTHANVVDFRSDANFIQTSFSSVSCTTNTTSSTSGSSSSGGGCGSYGGSNNLTGNKKEKDLKSQTISSFMANDKKIEKVMTENENNNNVEPFNLLEQSMMIDVKQDVNINADHGNPKLTPIVKNINSSSEILNIIDFNKDNDDDTDEADVEVDDNDDDGDTEQEDNAKANQPTDEHQFDNIPLPLTTQRVAKLGVKYSNAKQATNLAKLRISKAGIPRKGTSVRSQKKYKCPVCQKIYVSPQNMKEHLRNTHTNPNQKYVCTECGKEYSWKHALDRHFKSKHR